MRNRVQLPNTTTLTTVVLICGALALSRGYAETPNAAGSSSADVQQLATKIDQKTSEMSRALSPAAHDARQRSLSRFYQWVEGYCGVLGATSDPRCVHDQYFNYLDHISQSVYSVGHWKVYETAAYGLLWADGDLLDQDFAQPLTWDLQVTWPHVDAEPSPISRKMGWALKEKVHSLVADWAVGGWELNVSNRVETINACYASVGIEKSTYRGGAHSNVEFEAFNWNRKSDALLNIADLFKPGSDWRHQLVALYEKHVRAGDSGVRPTILEDEPFLTKKILELGVDKETLVTDQGLKIVIGGLAPAYGMILPGIEMKWSELQPLLAPSALCTIADTPRP